MATETSAQREKQEQSIKARKHELFVDEPLGQDGPRKTFREYLRETPAAPLTKNVKLMLWGSAAPVVLLFFGALLTGKGAAPKPPKETVLPPSLVKPQVLVTQKSEEKPPKEAIAPAGNSTKGEAGEKPKKPPEEKPKSKKSNKKPTDKPAPNGEAVAKTDKPAKDNKDSKDDPKDKKADRNSSNQGEKGKNDPKNKPDVKPGKDGPTPSSTTDKPRRQPLFKKKKAPVYTYPKRDGEKKDEKGDSDKSKPSTSADPGLDFP
jgi:hypothetical protein